MSTIINKEYFIYLGKGFIAWTIPMCLIAGLFASQYVGYIKGFKLGFLVMSVGGMIFVVILGVTDYFCKRSLLKKYGKIDHRIRQKKAISLQETYSNTFQKSKNILRTIGAEITCSDLNKGAIKGVTGISYRSVGEEITVSIEKVNESLTNVDIASRPKFITTLVDYGKNFENVEKFSLLLVGRQV